MTAKRQATSELNHDNWNEDEEPEDRGHFRTASEEEMKSRIIKKARRKVAGTTTDAGEAKSATKSVFSGFSGFGKSATTPGASSSSPFSFLAKLPVAGNAAPKAAFSFGSDSGAGDKPSTTMASPSFPFLSKTSSSTATATVTNTNASSAFSFMPQTSVSAKSSSSDVSVFNSKASVAGGSIFSSTSVSKSSTEPKQSIFGGNTTQSTAVDKKNEDRCAKSPEFCSRLKRLNEEVSAWIQKHVAENPICLLTPIFKDYEKFVKEIEESDDKGSKPDLPKSTTPTISLSDDDDDDTDEEDDDDDEDSKSDKEPQKSTSTKFNFSAGSGQSKTSLSTTPFSFNSSVPKPGAEKTDGSDTKQSLVGKTSTPSTSIFSFGVKTDEAKKDSVTSGDGKFSFGAKSNIADTASKDLPKPVDASPAKPPSSNGFSFGLKTADKTTTNPTGFTFGSGPGGPSAPAYSFLKNAEPFSFGNIKPPAAVTTSAGKTEEGEDDEDTPPKVEFKQVVEEDAVFSKKCKVFVKKDGDFVERGVGTLYLKPVKDSEKTQLIVRADTNLGNILVNLILNSAIPCERRGKNNVLLVCLPTPEAEKPTPTLLRVKTGEEADQLLEMIKKYKK